MLLQSAKDTDIWELSFKSQRPDLGWRWGEQGSFQLPRLGLYSGTICSLLHLFMDDTHALLRHKKEAGKAAYKRLKLLTCSLLWSHEGGSLSDFTRDRSEG